MSDLLPLARRLDEAARTATATPQLSLETELTVEQAYALQALVVQQRLDRGETLAGMKMGLTSQAKMRQVGVHEPIWARLTGDMRVEDGGTLALDRFIHPRAEPEIAFVMGRALSGPVSPAEALAAVESVAPAMEIIDSRYENFKFSLADVVADNASSSAFVIGPRSRADTDLANLGMVVEFDGRAVQIGSSAAILGHPARSLAMASRLAGAAGFALEPGWIVLAGGATAATHLKPGTHVRCSVQNLGRVGFSVGRSSR